MTCPNHLIRKVLVCAHSEISQYLNGCQLARYENTLFRMQIVADIGPLCQTSSSSPDAAAISGC